MRTDIAGANGAGLDCLLVAGGIHAEEFAGGGKLDLARIETAAAIAGVQPTLAAARFDW